VTRVTSHAPYGAAAYISLPQALKKLIHFTNTQTLKFHSPVSPDHLNARSLGFPKSVPLKNPRSANILTGDYLTVRNDKKHMNRDVTVVSFTAHALN